MLFNSLHFLCFFLIVTPAYFLLEHKHRWKLLLAASCYFYMTFIPVYILILGFTIIIDYFAGILIAQSSGKKRKQFLILSIAANVGVLALFKYFNFLNDNLTALLGTIGYHNNLPYLHILLPIGLSFHTFQAMSYTIEVYRGNQKPERHFGLYALYVMFYPQLVAGPIERPQNILPQLHEEKRFKYDDVVEGLKLMLWGLFKKIVIADRLAIYVDSVYNNAGEHSAVTLITATVFFTFQIYCDFSGYSDIAIGCARVMGFRLMVNFRRPLLSKSVGEFWSRWHISLSTWFRDYLYIPLGGRSASIPRWYLNLFIVFLISGLWHGAAWTFIIWGALNGVFQMFSIYFKRYNHAIITFSLITFSRVFFRANNIDDALLISKNILTLKPGGLFTGNPSTFVYGIAWILFLLIAEYSVEYFPGKIKILNNSSKTIRYAGYATMVLFILLFGVFNGNQFIYFQF
jgi:alginate O-acetyltransferase complex protein AlgI